jgi:hypothetical protein
MHFLNCKTLSEKKFAFIGHAALNIREGNSDIRSTNFYFIQFVNGYDIYALITRVQAIH